MRPRLIPSTGTRAGCAISARAEGAVATEREHHLAADRGFGTVRHHPHRIAVGFAGVVEIQLGAVGLVLEDAQPDSGVGEDLRDPMRGLEQFGTARMGDEQISRFTVAPPRPHAAPIR